VAGARGAAAGEFASAGFTSAELVFRNCRIEVVRVIGADRKFGR